MSAQKSHKLIFGVIGYGSIGKVHCKILKQLKCEYYIYDPKFKQGEKFLTFSKLNKICNTIIIASPSFTHFNYLKFYSNRNKHIFIEKPFSHEINKTKKYINKIRKNKKIIAVNYNLRVRECILYLKKILKKNVKIYWSNFIMSSDVLSWRKNYNFSENYTHHKKAGGIIFDSIHEIDLNLFLFRKIKFLNSINLNLNKKNFKKKSFSFISLIVKDKFLSTIHLDYYGKPDQRKINILSNIGLIKVDIKKNTINITNKKNQKIVHRSFDKNKLHDYKKMIQNFIDCIKNPKKNVICDSKDAIKNVQLALKANV